MPVFGTPISLAPSANALVIGGSTSAILSSGVSPPVLTKGSLSVDPNGQDKHLINGQTLTAGGDVTLAETNIPGSRC